MSTLPLTPFVDVTTNGHIPQSQGLTIERYFTDKDVHPYDQIEWETRTAEIIAPDGEVIFRQEGVEFPKSWSQQATNIVAQKYFRGPLDSPQREYSVKQMISRVVDQITKWGYADEYFNLVNSQIFKEELTFILLYQMASFNSPVWFNIGVPHTAQQASACFILDVEDNLESIFNWYTEEGNIFANGSGSGTNLSKLRGKNELLSGGGKASGPMSFDRVADANGGVIKSGGKTRRSARMIILDVDHPDIEDFISCKLKEEKKARVLMAAGYDSGLDGEVYQTLAHQNGNYSVGVTDDFMERVEENILWVLRNRVNGDQARRIPAKDLFKKIAQAAHECADPGIQFQDTMNAWHTCPQDGKITTTNPCQPDHATVLTPEGIRTFSDINIGSIIWSGTQWTRVTQKVSTGIKPVFEYHTTAGIFIGTREHQVISQGERVEIQYAETIDTAHGPEINLVDAPFDAQAVVDGLVLGDGTAKALSATSRTPYILLCVGKGDHSYFSPESGVSEYITEKPFDKKMHRVKTTFEYNEIVKTYDRCVPDRYFYSSENLKSSFLRGLYSANGSIIDNRITLKAASFRVIADVQQMLSSLGIRSYYTTNMSHDVTFGNGTYTCKESYDLNISTDRDVFLRLIGFIQPDKQARLEAICGKVITREKVSFEVKSTRYLGRMPVFDITVDAPEHTYWTGGLLVSNCSEFIFLNNNACNLSSINLIKFLMKDGKTFDTESFSCVVDTMVIAKDILVGNADYPTEKITEQSHKFRTIGLGYTNLGGLLMVKGLPYDSDVGRDYATSITALMTGEAYCQSARLAEKLGSFPGYAENEVAMKHVLGKHLMSIDLDKLSNGIWSAAYTAWKKATYYGDHDATGYRNAQVTLLAPTGTISFGMDAATTGVEPEMSLVKYKKLSGGGTIKMVNPLVEQALQNLGYNKNDLTAICQRLVEYGHLPQIRLEDYPVFDCAFPTTPGGRSIAWEGHIKMCAALQPFLSGGISKTINMPNSSTVEDVERAYMMAWKLGLKSISIYRDGCKFQQPVTTQQERSPEHQAMDDSIAGALRAIDTFRASENQQLRRRLPVDRPAFTHKGSLSGHEFYITAGLYEDGSPGEVFLKVSKEGSTIAGLMDTIATLTSLALQYGVPLQALVDKFSHVRFEPSGFTGNKDIPMAKSLVDYIFRWLGLKFGTSAAPVTAALLEQSESTQVQLAQLTESDAPLCTECGSLCQRAGSCYICTCCGSSTGCG